MNKITIGLGRKMIVIDGDAQENKRLVSLVNHQLMQLGYMMSEDAFKAMSEADTLTISNWSKTAIAYYQSYLGDGSHKTLSDLVLEGDLFDTHMSLLSRYWKSQEWEPVYKKDYNFEPSKLKVLKYGNEDAFRNIFTSLVQVNTALTAKDFEVIEWFIDNYSAEQLPMPKMIPFKENLCMLAAKNIDVPVKTATDVLRIAAYMSGLGSDLIIPPKKIKENGWSNKLIVNPAYGTNKFRKFKRPEKRYLLSLLNRVANVGEMKTREGRWLRLLNMLNPQDYKKKYPKAYEAAYRLRNQSTKLQLLKSDTKNGFKRNPKVITWKGKLWRAYQKSFLDGLIMQKERPGEFARALDALLRNNPDHIDEILRHFKESAIKVSNKVLFELITHFKKRKVTQERSVFIPGARVPVVLPTLPVMKVDIIQEIEDTIWLVFIEKFKLLPNLGKVWIDEDLKKIPLPTNMKTLDDSKEIVIRGTRSPMGEDVIMINGYIYWTAGIDLDLSMTFLNPENGSNKVCSFRNKTPMSGVQHSGDIIPRMPGTYAEYIGVNIKGVLAQGFRYGLLTVKNFAGGSLNDVGAIVGFQEVNVLELSKTWLPTNAIASTKLGSTASVTALVLFDFQENEWILVDIDLKKIPVADGTEFVNYIETLAIPPKMSVYSLLEMHVNARGEKVSKPVDAETLFKFEDYSTSYEDIIKFML